MEIKFNLSDLEYKELISYCNLNDLLLSSVVKKSFTSGFNIERYGLLGGSSETVEVIKEVPVEKIVEVIKEVPVEIIKEIQTPPTEVKVIEYVDREVIIEVPVEKIVEKIVNIYDNSQIDELVGKTEQLGSENKLFSTKIQELEQQVEEFSTTRSEMENIFQNEKNELISKIEQLEARKTETVVDDTKQRMLEQTLQTVRLDNFNKDRKIKELEDIVEQCRKFEQKTGAVYLRGTNLDETLYK